MANPSPIRIEQLTRIWNAVGKSSFVIGAIAALYYVLAGLTPLTDLFLIRLPLEDLVELAKGIIIVSAIVLAVALFMHNKLTIQLMNLSIVTTIEDPSILTSGIESPHVESIKDAQLKAISNLSWSRIMYYIGWYVVGYYLFSVVTVRIDMGASDWALVGGLSVIFFGHYLIIGLVLAVIGGVNMRKALRQLENPTIEKVSTLATAPAIATRPTDELTESTPPTPEVIQPQQATAKSFILALIGLIAGAVAAFIAASAISVIASIQGLTGDAAVYTTVGALTLAFFAAPIYIPCLILVGICSVRAITKKQRKDLVVMGWLGVSLAFIPGIIMLGMALLSFIQ